MPAPRTDASQRLAELAAEGGIERIHVLAWRDLADVEAGGSELHAHEILKRWAAAGLEVTLRTSWAQGSPQEGVRDGYRIIRRAGRYLVFPRAVLSELAGRHGERDALVEIWNGVPFFSPVWARGPKVVFLHHHHERMWPLVLSPRLAAAGQWLESVGAPPFYRRSQIITLSESSRVELIEALGLQPDRISVVRPGIAERFTPGGERSPHPLIVSVGRLMPSKRFDALIQAAHRVREDVPDLELTIVGEGYESDNLRALVSELDAAGWVRFAGRVSDEELIDLYRRAWLVTSASISEGWGMTLTEAGACGTPSVATDIPGHRDAVQHDVSGLLAPNLDELARQIRDVCKDDDLRARLAQGALAYASTLTWDATAEGTLAALVADARRRRGRR